MLCRAVDIPGDTCSGRTAEGSTMEPWTGGAQGPLANTAFTKPQKLTCSASTPLHIKDASRSETKHPFTNDKLDNNPNANMSISTYIDTTRVPEKNSVSGIIRINGITTNIHIWMQTHLCQAAKITPEETLATSFSHVSLKWELLPASVRF